MFSRLAALVRRPFTPTGEAAIVTTGEAELEALRQSPANAQLAQALVAALTERAALDADFHRQLHAWEGQARQAHIDPSDVNNTISGGTQNGPVLQGRDMYGFSFSSSAALTDQREA
ncbi:hypothetical protein [Streptomyces californicus]|uniref:hypothetical protein n=1 Tax=Streptomyces californicus TaxID=67351 RepID=UPI0037A4EBF6